MLTFEFTGVEGRMTGSEILTSGMVGKTVQILFDDSWANLTKTLVFRAGQTQVTVPGDTSPAVIPTKVLAHPFQKLFVGVYGTDASGTLVIPTLMAEGPMIRYGADPTELSPADGDMSWKKLLEQIGDPAQLETGTKESLVAAINELNRRQVGGMSQEAIALLITILRHALYESDQSDAIDALETALNAGATDPEVPEVTMTHITAVYTGDSVPVGTDIYSLQGLTVTAHYSDGTTAIITGYNLGGKISKAGNNTLSVVYNGQSTTVSIPGYETDKTLTGITAHYTGGSVPVGTALTALYPNLTVMAQYSDGSTEAVVGYGLSGAIANGGDNTITVMFGGFTTTFTVVGIDSGSGETGGTGTLLHSWDYTQSLVDSVSGAETILSGAVRDADGLHFTASTHVATTGIDIRGKTIEVEFGEVAKQGTVHGRCICLGAAADSTNAGQGLVWHSTGFWATYGMNASGWADGTNSDPNAISGGTVKIPFKTDSQPSDILLNGEVFYPGFIHTTMYKYLNLGSVTTAFCNMTVKKLKIYEGA